MFFLFSSEDNNRICCSTWSVYGYHILIAIECVNVVINPLQGHRQVQHAIIPRRIFVGSAEKSCK